MYALSACCRAVLLHSLTSDRRAAMPPFSLTPRRQKFGRTRGGERGGAADFRGSAGGRDSWAAGLGKKNEAQNVLCTRSPRAAVRFCFTPSLLIAGPRCHPSPSHPGDRNLAALEAANVAGPQTFEGAQGGGTPGRQG